MLKPILSLLLLFPLLGSSADRPNLIVFLADDLGYGDLGASGIR